MIVHTHCQHPETRIAGIVAIRYQVTARELCSSRLSQPEYMAVVLDHYERMGLQLTSIEWDWTSLYDVLTFVLQQEFDTGDSE